MRWKETELEEHLEWKPDGATDRRGMSNGMFVGDNSLEKISRWIKQKGR